MDFQLDARPYFQILHNLIRQSDLDYDPELAANTVNWVRENAMTLRKVTGTAEFAVIMAYYAYWDKHKIAPDSKVMDELIREKQQNQGMLDVMAEYEKYRPELEQVSFLNLPVYLDQRIADYEKYQLLRALEIASQIVVSATPMKDKKVTYFGPRDALKYFHERLQQGILLDDVPASGGLLADTTAKMESRYDRSESDSKANILFIPTGIPIIDGHLGGLRRKELNGILGFVAQKKSTVLRTLGYNAAKHGFRVLHIPLESDCEEEETFYTVHHAARLLGTNNNAITKKRIDQALLTADEKERFFKEIVPNFQQSVGKNIVVYTPGASRAWADVRSIIERENDKEPVDLVLLDYLTMLSTPGNRDDVADKMMIVQDAKRLAMTANDGKGLCIVTPVQGNREGYKNAGDNGGEWSTTGIAKYSELDKSLDNLFYVYFDDEMNSQNKMMMGSCKTRRDSNIPATLVPVNPLSSMIAMSSDQEVTLSAPLPDKPSMISAELIDLGTYATR